ncbi:MAG: UPF0175 family protein [bacterium]
MKTMQINITDDLLECIKDPFKKEEDLILEYMILELYREGKISSGKASRFLNMDRAEFIKFAGDKGIPFLRISKEELSDELKELNRL